MNAAQLAAELKKKEQDEKQRLIELAEQQREFREKEEKKFIKWIKEALGSFKLNVKKEWFAGKDYWTLNNNKKCLCSCVLGYEHWELDASDDCRNIPCEGWRIIVCSGQWAGPHDKRGHSVTTKDDLNKRIAEIMKDHI